MKKCDKCQNNNICKYSKEYNDIYEKIKSLAEDNNVILKDEYTSKEESIFEINLWCKFYKDVSNYFVNKIKGGIKNE